jgi:hypothetical protein
LGVYPATEREESERAENEEGLKKRTDGQTTEELRQAKAG